MVGSRRHGNQETYSGRDADPDSTTPPAVWDPSWPTHPVDPLVLPCAHTSPCGNVRSSKLSRAKRQSNNSDRRASNNNSNYNTQKSNHHHKNQSGQMSPPSMSMYGPGELSSSDESEAKQSSTESIQPLLVPAVKPVSPPQLQDVKSSHTTPNRHQHPSHGPQRGKPRPDTLVTIDETDGREEEVRESPSGTSPAVVGTDEESVPMEADNGSTSMHKMLKFSLDSPPTPSSSSFSFTFQCPDAGFLGGGSHPSFSP
jgi:hypothetical protein